MNCSGTDKVEARIEIATSSDTVRPLKKFISNRVIIHTHFEDTNMTIWARARRTMTGPLAGKESVAVYIIEPHDMDVGKKRRFVNERVPELMPSLKRLTSESPLKAPSIDLDDNDNPIYLHWDCDDLATRLPRGDKLTRNQRNEVAASLKTGHLKAVAASYCKGPMKDTSKIIIRRITVDNVKIKIEAQSKQPQNGPLQGLECVAIRITGLETQNTTKMRKLVDERVLHLLPSLKRLTKRRPLQGADIHASAV